MVVRLASEHPCELALTLLPLASAPEPAVYIKVTRNTRLDRVLANVASHAVEDPRTQLCTRYPACPIGMRKVKPEGQPEQPRNVVNETHINTEIKVTQQP